MPDDQVNNLHPNAADSSPGDRYDTTAAMVAVLLPGSLPAIYGHVQYQAILLWLSDSNEHDKFEILFSLRAVKQDVQQICHSPSTSTALTDLSDADILRPSLIPQDISVTDQSILAFGCGGGAPRHITDQAGSTQPGTQRTKSRRRRRKKCQLLKASAVQGPDAPVVEDDGPYLPPRLHPMSYETNARPSTMRVSEQFDPWADWACAWSVADTVYQTRICVQSKGNPGSGVFVNLITPTACSASLTPINIPCDLEAEFSLSFAGSEMISRPSTDLMTTMRQITALYVQASKMRYQDNEKDFVLLLGPDQPQGILDCWLSQNSGSEPVLQAHARGIATANMGLVHDGSRYNEPLIFRKWVPSPNGTILDLRMECEQLSRRRRQLCRGTDEDLLPPVRAQSTVIPAQACTVDRLPFSQSIFGLFVPALLDTLERRLVAARLCDTILGGIEFTSLDHVVTALTTPYARPRTNYQRYEFFGDSVLKYMVSCQLFLQHGDWQEHELTRGRDQLVQNHRLTRAALTIGLDAFIIDRRTSLRRYTVPLISQRSQQVPKERYVSSKALADVIEALIGAAYVDGGLLCARECIQRLLPEISIQALPPYSSVWHGLYPIPEHGINETLKSSIGYTFRNETLLVEALTHPSCGHHSSIATYQRLEFLGDAVLDMVIVDHFLRHLVEIPQGQMTLIKHAVSNGNLLAFFCLEIGLWRFMRFRNPSVRVSQDTIYNRYISLRDQINLTLKQGEQYPWQELSELNADKHFSDVIESILGAIFVDSAGDLSACEMFLDRIGWPRYLQRILDDSVSVTHPKNAVQMLTKSLATFGVTRSKRDTGEVVYDCAVHLRDIRIALVRGFSCRAEAEVKAANAVMKLLQKNTLDSLIFRKSCI